MRVVAHVIEECHGQDGDQDRGRGPVAEDECQRAGEQDHGCEGVKIAVAGLTVGGAEAAHDLDEGDDCRGQRVTRQRLRPVGCGRRAQLGGDHNRTVGHPHAQFVTSATARNYSRGSSAGVGATPWG